jgi:exopolysaccharide biosynthesis polyprenyl glycosylphosphotransferase
MSPSQETARSLVEVVGEAIPKTRVRRRAIGLKQVILALPVLDALFMSVSFVLAYHLRFKSSWLPYPVSFSPQFYWTLLSLLVPTWLLIFAVHGLYNPRYLFGGTREYSRIVYACLVGVMAVIVLSFMYRGVEQPISPGWLLIYFSLSVLTIISYRFAFRRLIYRLRQRGLFLKRSLIVGANQEGQAMAEQFRSVPTAGVHVMGFVDDTLSYGTVVSGLPVLGDSKSLKTLVEEQEIDELIVSPASLSREALLDIYRTFNLSGSRVEVKLSPGLFEILTTGATVQEVGFVPLVSLNKLRITGIDAFLKSTLDYVGAAVGLILLWPFLLLIALLVKLDSPGPAIHRRRVLGVGGQIFDAFKFRTMRVDSDEYLEQFPELAEELERYGRLRDDPRVTRLGKFLRKASIDKLPQLINVLRGQMSLVGPYIISPPEWIRFGKWKYNLLTVKPGITGLWQVSGGSDLSYGDRVRLDMHYICNYTIWLDLRILCQTVGVVLRGMHPTSYYEGAAEKSITSQERIIDIARRMITLARLNHKAEKLITSQERLIEAYAIARFRDHSEGQPFRIGLQYILEAGISKLLRQGFKVAPFTLQMLRKGTSFEIVVYAEDMDILPSWFQQYTFDPDQANWIEFIIVPKTIGYKVIRVEFYHESHWLQQISFVVEVIES